MKKTLLMAAAALAVSVISSQAQVYSLNTVGYYNLVLPTGYNMVSVQFAVGSSNGASEVFPNIPDGTELFTWKPSTASFVYNFYDTGAGATTPPNSWYMADYATITNQPVLPPGTACFLLMPSLATNTVVGTVVNSNTIAMIAGYNMKSSTLPLGGATTQNLFKLDNLPDGTELFTWKQSTASYVYNFYDTGAGATTPANSWYMSDYATATNAPNLTVGQGMFFLTPSTFNWTQTYTNQ